MTIDGQGFGGTVANTAAGVVEALGSGANIQLNNATILGGVLKTSGSNAVIEALSDTDDVIGGATIAGAVVVDDGATLTLNGVIANSGTLFANGDGSTLAIAGTINGGIASVGNGIVDIQRASNESVVFQSAGAGGLQLDDSSAYSGKVSGFGANTSQFIDFTDIGPGATFIYTPNVSSPTSGGVLTVSSAGTPAATIHLVGNYVTSNFTSGSDANGNLEITDPRVGGGGTEDVGSSRTSPPRSIDLPNIAFGVQTTLAYAENSTDTGGTLTVRDGRHAATLALLGNYVAGSFAAAADGHGGTLVSEARQLSQQPLLTHPPHG
jgi:trimeric autotransporter adhesin